jgi:hypothetical protein
MDSFWAKYLYLCLAKIYPFYDLSAEMIPILAAILLL